MKGVFTPKHRCTCFKTVKKQVIMRNPPHPGKIIRLECLEALGLTMTAAAKGLGVTRSTVSDLINCRAGVSPEMAIRLEKAGWSTAEAWLKLQMQHDLWQARRKAGKLKVRKFEKIPA